MPLPPSTKGDILVEEGRFFKPPIHVQDEIAILAVAPERLVPLSFTLGVIDYDAIDDLPMSGIAGWRFPTKKVLPVEERDKSLGRRIVCRPYWEAKQ